MLILLTDLYFTQHGYTKRQPANPETEKTAAPAAESNLRYANWYLNLLGPVEPQEPATTTRVNYEATSQDTKETNPIQVTEKRVKAWEDLHNMTTVKEVLPFTSTPFKHL